VATREVIGKSGLKIDLDKPSDAGRLPGVILDIPHRKEASLRFNTVVVVQALAEK